LENEHVGNKDQYRATRDIPLPYNINKEEDEDEEAEAEEEENNQTGWMPVLYH
jgi:xenotropic and polytropic retrovirus receptor 1